MSEHPPVTPKSKRKKPKPFSGEFWCGFVNGRPFVFRDHPASAPAANLSKARRLIARDYYDVRRVRIIEVQPRKSK